MDKNKANKKTKKYDITFHNFPFLKFPSLKWDQKEWEKKNWRKKRVQKKSEFNWSHEGTDLTFWWF